MLKLDYCTNLELIACISTGNRCCDGSSTTRTIFGQFYLHIISRCKLIHGHSHSACFILVFIVEIMITANNYSSKYIIPTCGETLGTFYREKLSLPVI